MEKNRSQDEMLYIKKEEEEKNVARDILGTQSPTGRKRRKKVLVPQLRPRALKEERKGRDGDSAIQSAYCGCKTRAEVVLCSTEMPYSRLTCTSTYVVVVSKRECVEFECKNGPKVKREKENSA